MPLVCVATTVALGAGLCALAGNRRRGLCAGLAVLRSLDGRSRVVGLVLVAVLAQIARNYLILRSTGVAVSLFDSIAVLIAMVTISQLPLAPSVGAAATVLILGAHGVATVAAAGVLLTRRGRRARSASRAWAAGGLAGAAAARRRGRAACARRGATERAYLRRPHQADLGAGRYRPAARLPHPAAGVAGSSLGLIERYAGRGRGWARVSSATTWSGLIAIDRPVPASVSHANCMIEPREAPTIAASMLSADPPIS